MWHEFSAIGKSFCLQEHLNHGLKTWTWKKVSLIDMQNAYTKWWYTKCISLIDMQSAYTKKAIFWPKIPSSKSMICKMPIQLQIESIGKITKNIQNLHMQNVYHAKICKMPIHKNKWFEKRLNHKTMENHFYFHIKEKENVLINK